MTASDARFAEIYETFFRRLYGYCIRRATPDRVDDVVAETFLVAWRRIHDVPAGDEALPWLYAVAFKVLGNQWRSQTRQRKLEDKLSAVGIAPVSSTEDFVIRGQEARQVLKAVSRLKRTDQEILKLGMWEEVSHADITVILGISPGAVKQRLFQARKNLTREYNRLEDKAIKSPAAQRRWTVITEDRVMTIFVEANPAPDVDELDLVQTGSAAYLATLAQRSSEMSELDTRERKPVEKNRSLVPFLVAAAVMVVLGVALVLIDQEPDEAPAIGVELSAVAVAEGWAVAVNDGDAEAALVFLHPDEREGMTELMAFFSAAYAGNYTNEDCAETPTGVECTLVIDDPLMVVLELDQKQFFAEFVDGYLSIGSVGDRMASLTTFSTYLFNYQPDSYESTCSPVAVGATPVFSSALAATTDCGAVYLEFVADAAAWVNDGRPIP